MTGHPGQGVTARDRQARVAAYVAFAVQGLCFAALVSRLNQIRDAHHMSDEQINMLVLLVPVIAGVGSAIAAPLMGRFGSGPVLRVTQPLVCLMILTVGLSGSANLPLYAAIVLFGLFVGGVDASMNAQAVAAERAYGVSILTGFHALWSAAAGLGAVWAWFSNEYIFPGDLTKSLAVGFAIPAVLGIAVSALSGTRLYRKAEEVTAPAGEALKAAAKLVPWRPVLIIGIAMACFYVADSMLSNFGTLMFDKDLGSKSVAPLGLAAYQVAMVASRAVADFGVRRFGATPVVRASTVVGALGLLLVVVAPNAPVAIAGFAVAGLGLCVVAPISFSAAGKADPSGLGIAVARVNIFNYVGFVVGAVIVLVVQPLSSYQTSYAVPALLALVIIALAKGFEPKPAAPAEGVPPVAERPTV
ncbi:MFS transporter [Actinomadura macrotermitis]|uniref:Inner membrane protein YbjJ n=1 Tax=Actinomadura macrotermitis TaxID=2585200 RepID=A0A7K0BRT9_9ACTN|nr:MFS transporter [Actinomadura macrotermitis]MQY03908.1 Inner membrane protein YbjJ [Actinomadura macrotermitis]